MRNDTREPDEPTEPPFSASRTGTGLEIVAIGNEVVMLLRRARDLILGAGLNDMYFEDLLIECQRAVELPELSGLERLYADIDEAVDA